MATANKAKGTKPSNTPRPRVRVSVDPITDAPKSNPPTDDDEGTEAAQEEIVTVTIPKAFKLTLDDHTQVQYHVGTHDMPRSHAEHWYAKAQGVEIYGESGAE